MAIMESASHTEHVFEGRSAHPLLAEFFPEPRPVWIHLDFLETCERKLVRADELPMIVRAQGLALNKPTEGVQHAWVRSNRGQWLGLIEFTPHTAELGEIPCRALLPAAAFRLQEGTTNGQDPQGGAARPRSF
jgi:hypothetical protein